VNGRRAAARRSGEEIGCHDPSVAKEFGRIRADDAAAHDQPRTAVRILDVEAGLLDPSKR
jgi:hypothetical protein